MHSSTTSGSPASTGAAPASPPPGPSGVPGTASPWGQAERTARCPVRARHAQRGTGLRPPPRPTPRHPLSGLQSRRAGGLPTASSSHPLPNPNLPYQLDPARAGRRSEPSRSTGDRAGHRGALPRGQARPGRALLGARSARAPPLLPTSSPFTATAKVS